MKNLLYLCLALGVVLSSCQKNEIQETALEEGMTFWYKDKIYKVKSTLDDKGGFTTAYMPEELRRFYEDTAKATVTHYINEKDKQIVCLYDSESEFRARVTIESDDTQNRQKGYNGCRITTFANALSVNIPVGISGSPQTFTTLSGQLRQTTNDVYSSYHFNSNSGYGKSISWVGNTENDNIEGIRFERFDGQHIQFMGCSNITWGGSKLWITNKVNASTDLDIARLGFGNRISSYEYFQANVAVHGINF